MLTDWLSHIDKRGIVGAIFFDLKKAFDVVDHEILLQKNGFIWRKREAHLFTGLNHTFQTDSMYRGWIKNVKSPVSQKRCTLGIRFCSLYFLIFINDTPLHLQTDIDRYADDTVAHTAGKTLVVVEPADFNTWCIDNNMGVHYGKTHSFVVGS